MTPQLPAPDEGEHASGSTERVHPRKTAGPKIPAAEELCEQLLKLNSLVLMNIITTAQAAVIQRSLSKVLDAQQKRARADQPGLSEKTLADLCRLDPRVISYLEPFLTEEQVAHLMGVVKDDYDGPT